MKRLFLLLFLASAPVCICAQTYDAVEVQVSAEKVNIEGKTYYVHKVLPRQTVYSICKAYGVTEQQLAEANPALKDGLKAGASLLVPISGTVPAAKAAETAKETARETAAASAEEVRTDDPAGPSSDGQSVIEHRVRWYESLTSIARKYGITPAEIWAFNDLRESDSIRGRILRIPVPQNETLRADADDDAADTEPEEEEEIPSPDTPAPVRPVRHFSAQEPLRISLVLPIDAGGNASASFLNFYCGALMAIQEQKDKGAHLDVYTYDLSQGAGSIVADARFQGSDIVIGPVEAGTFGPFLRHSDESGTILVSPLDHKADFLVSGHPGFFQVPTPVNIQIRNLVAGLTASGGPVILLHSNFTGESALVALMEEELRKGGVSYRKASLSDLGGLLPAGASAPARILIGSENQTFCIDAIRTLNALVKKNTPMEVWCTNRVRNYETSDPDALFNLSVHTAAPYFVDYRDEKDRQFILRYRALYSAEPDDFAFQGHDLLTFFITAMMQQGTAFIDRADRISMQLLHCDMHFVREDEESGWRNHATRNLYYDKSDFSIVLTK